MAMISSLCPLFVLVVVAVAAARAPRPSKIEKALVNSVEGVKPASSGALTLLYNVFQQITEYECKRDAADCDAWNALQDIHMLERVLVMSGVSCDAAEGKDTELCESARELLGGGDLSHEEILQGLIRTAQGITVKDYPLLNGIRDAVVEYACDKEPEQCTYLRKFVSDENGLEGIVAEDHDI